ncbi:hypothetical protein AAFF_G00297550 [Aldrovandia affinis]|uniref:ribonuclease H n=1 Tax=Aldrovandia affinis TaxID=143900 RepID=A0AAD7SQ40_9TELE|nr:hypothetical protein AAFF_G00297550 [Aldrovandia affinis]
MPFGLCNAPATFEQLMERVLGHVPKQHCIVYLDDFLIHAGDLEGALRHLREVFAAIHQAGLRLNPKKCQLFRRETAFLGHVVSADGVATDLAKIAAVCDWPPPTNVRNLRSFLGLASYYRRYVQDFATIARPLHRLTNRGQPYIWDDPCAQAFTFLQTTLITAPVLAYPDANRPFILDTDASNAEWNYCVTHWELLAVIALRHFRPYLHGVRFLVRTNHASLTWLLNFKNPKGQVACWLETLQGYDFELRHCPG